MNYDEQIIASLDGFRSSAWTGIAFRHMFGELPPDRENNRGARWNPPETPAIYTSLDRETALAEAESYISLQPLRPQAPRRIYRIQIALNSVLDLSDWATLATLGLDRKSFGSIDHTQCQHIGGAVDWLRHDGLLVPSARAEGTNLVIFPNRQVAEYKFEVLDFEELSDK